MVDDAGFPKKGQHWVGPARQYCGVLGKQDNCQVAVSVSVANETVSLPVAYQLYLPESWANDRKRRRAAGVPDHLTLQPKWQIALAQIRMLQAEGVPPAPVVADAGYGDTTAFREALTTAGLAYVVGVKKETTAWPPGQAPRPPKRWKGRGRPPTHVRRTASHTPQSLKKLALGLSPTAWRTVTWREGTRRAMRLRLARGRVRAAPLRFPKVSRRGALPVRPERHVPTSIATAYELLARALLQRLPCRSCGRSPESG